MALYDRIGRGYDETRRADPTIVETLSRLLAPRDGGRYLDVGSGSGNYAIALRHAGLDVVGVDPSARMLARARAKAPDGAWLEATAEALPFADGAFDGAWATHAVHHFADLEAAFSELHRVLESGRFVILTSDPEQMRGFWLNHYFPAMMARSMAQVPAIPRIEAALRRAGFQALGREPWLQPARAIDHFLYCGKHAPERYFDAAVRAGISSFADLAAAAEVGHGLARLRADIDAGRFDAVRAAYDDSLGDYLFLHATA